MIRTFNQISIFSQCILFKKFKRKFCDCLSCHLVNIKIWHLKIHVKLKLVIAMGTLSGGKNQPSHKPSHSWALVVARDCQKPQIVSLLFMENFWLSLRTLFQSTSMLTSSYFPELGTSIQMIYMENSLVRLRHWKWPGKAYLRTGKAGGISASMISKTVSF